MDMSGEQLVPASREAVWNALNDPEILRACIPGCQELTKISDTEMTAVAVIKVGPVSARFQGAVTLSDLDPPNGYRITGEGQGGVAGFARGTAAVQLEPAEGGTLLRYQVDAQIGGKLAQLGGRLIDATARKMSGLFFEKFAQELLARQQPVSAIAPAPSGPAAGIHAQAHASRIATADRRTPAGTDHASPIPASRAIAGSGLSSVLRIAGGAVLGAAAVLLWLGYGGQLPSLVPPPDALAADGRAHVSPDFASAVQLIMAAAIGYLFGRR